MQDLRNYLDFISELNLKTESLLKDLEAEHRKTLPKKRASKAKASAASFKVTIKEGAALSEITFTSEKEMESFMKLKQKTREAQILRTFGKPYLATNGYGKERAERLEEVKRVESINKAFGALSIQIIRL